ncbi:uncharacterized protein LOC136087780 [Hydra vulgaris]|uniref:Uncharacterized protein LOC136087780 n=1 Tax=Hydra vulgaris TaxID=6087 RepID=A0ABM4CZC7_HYDVU
MIGLPVIFLFFVITHTQGRLKPKKDVITPKRFALYIENDETRVNFKNGIKENFVGNTSKLLTKANFIAEVPSLDKEFLVSFDINPNVFVTGYHSVILFTTGFNDDQVPGIWFKEDGKGGLCVAVSISINSNSIFCTNPIKQNVWSNIEISQILRDSVYVFIIKINGIIVSEKNINARVFKNVKVYASNPWNEAQNGSIKDFYLINGNSSKRLPPVVVLPSGIVNLPDENVSKEYVVGEISVPLVKGKIIAEIPQLDKEYLISFDVYPSKFVGGYHNVLHFTTGFDDKSYGDRVPGIWFRDDGIGILTIVAAVNGFPGLGFITKPIGLKMWTNIKIAQVLKISFYIFTIRINEEVVFAGINYQPKSFDNVIVYASDPWHEAQDGLIKNFFVINGISNIITCPDGWLKNGSYCYLFQTNSKLNWKDSLSSCRNIGANLLSIANEVENSFVINNINNRFVNTSFWIGLNDIKHNTQRIFIWSDGTPTTFFSWKNLDTNNFTDMEICVEIQFNGWVDLPCSFTSSYICKKKGNGLKPITVISAYNKCPDDWLQFQNYCYFFQTFQEENWQNSLSSCMRNGSNLLSIADELENSFILNHLLSFGKYKHFWIGFSDNKKKSQRIFEWSDGTPQKFTNWNGLEPNNFGGNEDCVITNFIGWYDEPCNKSYFYICKKDSRMEAQESINQRAEFNLTKGLILGKIFVLKKEYSVSFSLKPVNFSQGLKSVLLLSLDNIDGEYGDKNLGVWFQKDGSGKLTIFSALNRKNNSYIETASLPLGQWSSIKISQILQEGKYWFSVDLNGINADLVENSDARDFYNITVYASDLWNDPQDGSISNFLIINGKPESIIGNIVTPLVKNKIIAVIPKLEKESLISFDVFPNKFVNGWHNVLHFTIGSNGDKYGDRIPGVWFHSNGQGRLTLSEPTSITIFIREFTTSPIQSNTWTNIQLCQILKGSDYVYTWRINGDIVFSEIMKQVSSFDNVTVYASDPWHDAQEGSIRNFYVINGIMNSSIQPIVVLPADFIVVREVFTLIPGLILGTLNVLKKEYSVSFDINPNNFSKSLTSVLHLTLGKNIGAYGDRNPGVWFNKDGSGKLIIFAAVSGNANFFIETNQLNLNQWSSIKICQSMQNNKYWFSVHVNRVLIHKVENLDARDFKNVKVYASDIWYSAQDAFISNLIITNATPKN